MTAATAPVASPAVFAAFAARQRATAAALAEIEAPRLAYVTRTGDAPRPARPVVPVFEPEAHCFVCHRHTNHAGEHDGLVEAGLAAYDRDGSVFRTDAWDEARAAEIREREYQVYVQEMLGGIPG